MPASKEVRALVTRLREQGATVTLNGCRYRITKPGCELAFLMVRMPHTRGWSNKLSELKNKGYDI